LGVRACACGQEIRRLVAPDDAGGHARGNHTRGLRRIEGSPGLGYAANRTGAIMGASVLVAVRGEPFLTAMADRRRAQGIAGRNRRRKRRANRCEDLHDKRDQDNRQELLRASTHQATQTTSYPCAEQAVETTNPVPAQSIITGRKDYCSCGFSDGWRAERFLFDGPSTPYDSTIRTCSLANFQSFRQMLEV
jgi:hypothetical protein